MDNLYKFSFTIDKENESVYNIKNANDNVNNLAPHTMRLNADNFIRVARSAGYDVGEDTADIIAVSKIINDMRSDIDFDIPKINDKSVFKPIYDNIYTFSKEKNKENKNSSKNRLDLNEISADIINTLINMCGGMLGEMIRSLYPELWIWQNAYINDEDAFILVNTKTMTYINPCECVYKYMIDYSETGIEALFIYALIRSGMNDIIDKDYIYITGKWDLSDGKIVVNFKNPENDSHEEIFYL